MDFQLTDEQRLLQEAARKLAEERFAAKAFTWERRGEYPWENAKALAEAGFLGILLPEADGGQGGTVMDAVLVMEAIAQVCPHTADVVQATSFGAIRAFAAYGQPAVKRRVMPELLRGEKIITVAMTEPGAGSAVTDLRTTARIEGDQVVLNGQKIFNSNGPHTHYFLAYVRFGPGTKGIGSVLAERGAPGFVLGKPERFMSGELHCALHFEDCRLPVENICLREDGFRKMMTAFNVERIGNATRSLSLGQAAFDRAVKHAAEREQFGRKLCEFQGIQWKFAEMRMKLDAARLLLYRAAANADRGFPSAVETSIAKAYCNQVGFEVANEALQIFGGYGYSTEFPLEYLVRRTRGWMIAGGTIEMMKTRIAEEIFQRRFDQRPR
jgi:alkylation response protein AidB-like acyl-CoA dehydrogenase